MLPFGVTIPATVPQRSELPSTVQLSKHGSFCAGLLLPYYRRDKVIGEWRQLLREKLHDLYSSPHINSIDQIKKDEMGGAGSTEGGRRKDRCIQVIV
jgi:hypothetical protein